MGIVDLRVIIRMAISLGDPQRQYLQVVSLGLVHFLDIFPRDVKGHELPHTFLQGLPLFNTAPHLCSQLDLVSKMQSLFSSSDSSAPGSKPPVPNKGWGEMGSPAWAGPHNFSSSALFIL